MSDQLKKILEEFERVVSNNDAFDTEDLQLIEQCKNEIVQQDIDQELLALQSRLPERQMWLTKLDTELQLSQFFPNLMAQFAAKDAELQAIIDMKINEQERKQTQY